MSPDLVSLALVSALWFARLNGSTQLPAEPGMAYRTTQMARQLVLERIEAIAQNAHCRATFGQENIDLNMLRFTVYRTRFYDATSADGDLKFSVVVGKAASPDVMHLTDVSDVFKKRSK
jgi:hypothetical protein